MQTPGLGHLNRRCPEVVIKEPTKLSRPDSHLLRKLIHRVIIKKPLSINCNALETFQEDPLQAGVPGEDSGRQRKQGRNPAAAAAAADL